MFSRDDDAEEREDVRRAASDAPVVLLDQSKGPLKTSSTGYKQMIRKLKSQYRLQTCVTRVLALSLCR